MFKLLYLDVAEVAHNYNVTIKSFSSKWGNTCDLTVIFQLLILQTPFGLIRMTAVVVPFLYVGTLISKNFAALLEEHDIFVPEDDDDDDWTKLST